MTDSRTFSPDELLYLGYVEKSHGLKGGFSARLFSIEGPLEIPSGTVILLDGTRPLRVTRCTPRGDQRINLTTAEIRNREEADACIGSSIQIRKTEADRKLGFLALFSFMGMTILSRGMRLIVVDIEPLGANSLLLVDSGMMSFQVPLALLLCESEIDWKTGIITLDLPEGLEDLQL